MIGDFKIDTNSSLPVYEQIKQAIKHQILTGVLEQDSQLTPIRELAAELKVNPNTIVKVYYQLSIEGFLYSKPGQGYFVKTEDRDTSSENKKLFRDMTEEYINKSVKLGYSINDIIIELKNHIKGGKHDT